MTNRKIGDVVITRGEERGVIIGFDYDFDDADRVIIVDLGGDEPEGMLEIDLLPADYNVNDNR